MFSPWRNVLDLPVRSLVADETFGDQFLPGLMQLPTIETEDFRNGSVRVKASPIPVPDDDQKQVQNHRFMA
jgi:hypothetical protein